MSTTQTAWTIGGLLDWTSRYLHEKGSEFPRLDAEVLLAYVLNCKRIQLYTRYEETAIDDIRTQYRELIRKRVEGCPVAYLVGKKEFFGLEFEVGPAVLIPRPDSEHVLMECLNRAKELSAPRVLDVGVGSGNLAVTIAHRLKGALVTAIDVSPEALAIAARNASRHGVADRVRFLQGDLFAALPPGESFDFILSNPPYIAHEEMADLPIGVREYEPHVALDGGPGGFAVFDRLLAEAKNHLKPGGWLILEIGSPQEKPARERIAARAEYELAATVFDYSNHPRVLVARRKPV